MTEKIRQYVTDTNPVDLILAGCGAIVGGILLVLIILIGIYLVSHLVIWIFELWGWR